MAVLSLTGARWTSKPPPGTDLDRTHALCPDHCWPFLSPQGTAQCLAKSARVAAPTTPGDLYAGGSSMVMGRKYGLSVRHTAATDRTRLADTTADVALVVPLSGWTCLIAWRKIDTTFRQGPMFGNTADGIATDRSGAYVWNDGNLYWHFGGATAGVSAIELATASITFGDDLWVFTTGPAGMQVWQNGRVLGSNSANPTRTNSYPAGSFGLSGFVTPTFTDFADTALVMTWRRQLAPAAIRSLSFIPWQVFQAQTVLVATAVTTIPSTTKLNTLLLAP